MAKSKEQPAEAVNLETSSVAADDIPPATDMLLSVASYVELKSPPQHIIDILIGVFRRELKTEVEWDALVQRESTRRMA